VKNKYVVLEFFGKFVFLFLEGKRKTNRISKEKEKRLEKPRKTKGNFDFFDVSDVSKTFFESFFVSKFVFCTKHEHTTGEYFVRKMQKGREPRSKLFFAQNQRESLSLSFWAKFALQISEQIRIEKNYGNKVVS
jgi:hypothetical protein